jgi:DNA-binding transcriptional ArsR family regulator
MAKINVPLIAMALTDSTRYGALELICSNEMISSQALCKMLGVSPPTLSHHIRELRRASLIESVSDGRLRRHKAKRETLDAYASAISRLARPPNHPRHQLGR